MSCASESEIVRKNEKETFKVNFLPIYLKLASLISHSISRSHYHVFEKVTITLHCWINKDPICRKCNFMRLYSHCVLSSNSTRLRKLRRLCFNRFWTHKCSKSQVYWTHNIRIPVWWWYNYTQQGSLKTIREWVKNRSHQHQQLQQLPSSLSSRPRTFWASCSWTSEILMGKIHYSWGH